MVLDKKPRVYNWAYLAPIEVADNGANVLSPAKGIQDESRN